MATRRSGSGVQINTYGPLFNEGTKVTPAIARAATKTRNYALAKIKSRTPVRTGLLATSWDIGLEGHGLRITNTAKNQNGQYYGGFVELGTRFMRPRAMVSNSLPEIQEYFKQQLVDELSSQLTFNVLNRVQQATGVSVGTAARTVTASRATQGVKPPSLSYGNISQPFSGTRGFGQFNPSVSNSFSSRGF